MKKIDAYQTEDGDVFAREVNAAAHEGRTALCSLINDDDFSNNGCWSPDDVCDVITERIDEYVSALLKIQAGRA